MPRNSKGHFVSTETVEPAVENRSVVAAQKRKAKAQKSIEVLTERLSKHKAAFDSAQANYDAKVAPLREEIVRAEVQIDAQSNIDAEVARRLAEANGQDEPREDYSL